MVQLCILPNTASSTLSGTMLGQLQDVLCRISWTLSICRVICRVLFPPYYKMQSSRFRFRYQVRDPAVPLGRENKKKSKGTKSTKSTEIVPKVPKYLIFIANKQTSPFFFRGIFFRQLFKW